MATVAELQQQQKNANAALKRGDITSSQYNQFTINQNRLIAEAQAKEKATQVQPSDTYTRNTTVIYERTSDTTKPKIISESTVLTKEIKAPVSNATPVEQALQTREALSNSENILIARGGTSSTTGLITGPNDALSQEAKIISGLSVEEKQQYNQAVQAQKIERIANLGLTLGAAAVAPVLGPTVAVKAAAGSILATQAINTGVAAYEGRDLTQSILTPTEAFQAGTSGIILTGAVGGGLKAAGVVAPKINAAAESALARSTRIFEGTVNKVSPGLGQATTSVIKADTLRLGVALDVREAQLAAKVTQNIVKPIKYSGAANRIAESAVSLKSNIVTAGQRSSDVILGGKGEAASFMRGVAKPNLTSYSKVAKTSAIYRDTELGISKAKSELRLISKPITSSAVKLTQDIKGSKAYTEFLYNKAVRSPNLIKTPAIQFDENIGTALYDNLLKSSASKTGKVVQKQIGKLASVELKTPYSVKAVGKVAAGKTRFTLKLKTPEDVLLKTERTPLRFEPPKVEAKQVTVQLEKATLKPLSSKASNLASGMPKPIALPYPKTASRVREEEETVYLSYPKGTGLGKPSLVVPSVSLLPSVSQGSRTKVSRVQTIVTPTVNLGNVNRISSRPKNRVETTIHNNLAIGIRTTTKATPITTIDNVQIITPRTTYKPIQVPKVTPKISLKNPVLPSFPTGGGSGFGGGASPLTGKWTKRNTRIKQFDEMLGTFGIQTSKKTVSTINKMDNAILGRKVNKKSRRSKR